MIAYRKLLLFTLLVFVQTACGVPTNGGGSSPLSGGSGGTGGNGTSRAGHSGATADGTITSGGGNTLDGKMTERYSQDISKLPEYVHFIIPQLRRLSQDRADVFVAYLQWVALNKAWYFVPVKLPTLPKERIALAFQSDQLALHSEKEIFIDKEAYAQESEKERAVLLMHEMVMGAKLLMKKSPEKQCAILNGAIDPSVCSDPAVLKMAVVDPNDVDSKDPYAILNGRDHESVRAMTIFIMDPKQQLSGATVAAKRHQLDFNFPWDRNLSNLDLDQFRDALDRTTLSQVSFKAEPSFANAQASDCYLYENTEWKGSLWTLAFGTGQYKGTSILDADFAREWKVQNSNSLVIDSKGVLDPSGSGQIVDLVEVQPYAVNSQATRYVNMVGQMVKMQFFVTRGNLPHVIEYRAIPVAVRYRPVYDHGYFSQEQESIEIKSAKPLRCRAQD